MQGHSGTAETHLCHAIANCIWKADQTLGHNVEFLKIEKKAFFVCARKLSGRAKTCHGHLQRPKGGCVGP